MESLFFCAVKQEYLKREKKKQNNNLHLTSKTCSDEGFGFKS